MARKQPLDFGVEQDMTPMIDIVFLLIIFFMVVTELTLDQAEMVLPVAPESEVVEPQPGQRVIRINVSFDENDENRVEQVQINNGPILKDEEALIAALRGEVQAYGKFEPNPSDPGQQDSTLEVLVRCDEAAKAGFFHRIFKACQTVKIYKVSLAAQNERLDDGYAEEQ